MGAALSVTIAAAGAAAGRWRSRRGSGRRRAGAGGVYTGGGGGGWRRRAPTKRGRAPSEQEGGVHRRREDGRRIQGGAAALWRASPRSESVRCQRGSELHFLLDHFLEHGKLRGSSGSGLDRDRHRLEIGTGADAGSARWGGGRGGRRRSVPGERLRLEHHGRGCVVGGRGERPRLLGRHRQELFAGRGRRRGPGRARRGLLAAQAARVEILEGLVRE